MTCVVAMTNGKDVIMTADKMGANCFTGSIYKDPKVTKIGNIVIGYAGSYRWGQLLERKIGAPRDGFKNLDTDLIDQIRNVLKENGHLGTDKWDSTEAGGVALIGWKGKIYVLQSDFSLLEPAKNYISIGSGEYHSEASIHTQLIGKTIAQIKKLSSSEMVKIAQTGIKCAASFVSSVGSRTDHVELKEEKQQSNKPTKKRGKRQ